jgi:hypothetical protein
MYQLPYVTFITETADSALKIQPKNLPICCINYSFIRNYWIFGLCPSSGIPKNTREHNTTEYRMMDKSKNPVIPSVMRHRQNPLESTYIFTASRINAAEL